MVTSLAEIGRKERKGKERKGEGAEELEWSS
jgi:hypothetical protein